MEVSGITFIKNALTLEYPIKEAIESISPLCDEVIINVGFDDPKCEQDDGTYVYLKNAFPGDKYIFFKSWWDPSKTDDGEILSEQTNLSLKKARGKFIQYIQGDEAVHEKDLDIIYDGIQEMKKNPHIDGLIFRYLHFYGNVDIIKYTRNTYRREVRLVRNKNVKSWKDAQGFRTLDGKKLHCKQIEARIFHYGWARKEQVMDQKVKSFSKLYHGQDHEEIGHTYQNMWGLKPFKNTHPKVMKKWIVENRNDVDLLSLKYTFSFKDFGLMFSDFVESLTGYRIGEYKNFRPIK
ncbi:MAG: glycosyltransferase family 2 protein [Deltaproteobacteria bacterium]|nr:MAG: glycosyltransferase family 2 protein [Deltaproteobacteria bacterium]